jgi:proline racemase
MSERFGREVLRSFYIALKKEYDITRDEIPYRVETVNKMLGDVFGIRELTTISKSIGYRLGEKLDVKLEEVDGLQLMDYIKLTKRRLPRKQAAKRAATRLRTKQEGNGTGEG